MSDAQSSPRGTFTKMGPPEQIRREVFKTMAARDIGMSSGLFYVPQVIEADPDAGRLELEFLPGLRTLSDLTARGDARLKPAMTLLGRGLAEVHDRLHLPLELSVPLPAKWGFPDEDRVFVHGDLTMSNVCWDEANDRLVIADWCTGPAIGALVTSASRYLDLMWFCANVFGEPSWLRRPLYPAGAMCDCLLSSYASGSGRFSAARFLRCDSELILEIAFHKGDMSARARFAERARRARWARWLRSSPVVGSAG